ncbi:Gfo/Idh/MocA family protein [Paenibacillus sp. GCM10027626]|uniref:Gfo/Idh/MocA family protein n=1 Tax=Paenibacillus sp. GCM10027626 TaxID=3273411 RepID=UPI00364391E8
MKFGIIGCRHGHISSFITEMIELGHTCAGIYEQDKAFAAQIAAPFGIPVLDSEEPLLADDIEIIGSSAINSEKIAIIEQCERYGKAIMVDKPAVVNRAQLERLKAVLDRGLIQVGMMLTERFRSSTAALHRLIQEGRLGRIVSISTRKPHRLSPEARQPWHFEKEHNGGIIADLFIHDFDLLRWLTGCEITGIHSMMSKRIMPDKPTFYDAATAQVMLGGGVMAQLYADWHTPAKSWTWGDCRLFVVGTEGSAELRLNGDPLVAHEELLLWVSNDHAYERLELDAVPVNCTADFLNRIAGKPALVSHEDMYMACRATVLADEQAVIYNHFESELQEAER